MTEHSAAQWKVGEFAEWGGYDCMTSEIRVGPARLDGEAYGQDTCVPATPEMIERMKADARLIVAAHEMLAALESIIEWADDNGKRFKFAADSDSGVVTRLRSAIKNATGKS